MKHIIHTIQNIKVDDRNTAVAEGIGGSIVIRFLLPEILHISYSFQGVQEDKYLLAAGTYMRDPSQLLVHEFPLKVSETHEMFLISCRDTVVSIERKYGLIEISYKGIVQHGGNLGTADTVIPDYQVRCLTSGGNNTYTGRFNFPLDEKDEFYGLGDKTGYPNRRGRRFSMFNRDSLGYDASNSDPLYKSIPFFIKINHFKGVSCGLFFDHPEVNTIDLGRESPFYYSIETNGRLFSYITLLGDTYKDLLFRYYQVTGFPYLPPLFSFGFFGSSMNYTEPFDAEMRILTYFSTIEKYEIPCEGMYVSSGYLKASDGKRYSFLWNTKKFPDYKSFLRDLAARGYNLCMNIKPGILTTHPWYTKLKEKGYFISDERGEPYTEFFWGGDASLIDFSNQEAVTWWKSELKEQYIDHGCTGIWNDNNEFEIEDKALRAFPVRSIYPLKMAEASYEVFKEKSPHIRPWIYSRSGTAGLQRYARTWSGDNVSDWKTLKYNQYMSVGFGLSGIPYYGHDLGGFFGEFPEEELLIRSCQSAVFQGRFVIHSWRENGNPTEPWSYQSALHVIRELIREHYRFIPYIYNTAIQTSITGSPMDRSLKLEFPHDEALTGEEGPMMFGDSILKVLVTEKECSEITIYLPKNHTWYLRETGIAYEGGTKVSIPTPIDDTSIWLAKAGCAIATTTDRNHLTTGFFSCLDFIIFPSDGDVKVTRYIEDDGKTELFKGEYTVWEISVSDSTVSIEKLETTTNDYGDRTFRLISGYSPVGITLLEFNPNSIPLCSAISVLLNMS